MCESGSSAPFLRTVHEKLIHVFTDIGIITLYQLPSPRLHSTRLNSP